MISLAGLAMVLGCGSGQPVGDVVKTVPASGVLTLKGKPLAFYQVTSFPDGGRPAVGVTDDSGQFILGTNEPGDGAVVGTQKVSLTWVGPPSDDPAEGIMEFSSPPAPSQPIDRKYFNAETSGLTVQIPDGGSKELAIDLP